MEVVKLSLLQPQQPQGKQYKQLRAVTTLSLYSSICYLVEISIFTVVYLFLVHY